MFVDLPVRSLPSVARQYVQFSRSQYWTPAQMGAYQDRMLRRLVHHAGVHVPYYRELFRQIKLDVAEFRGREDLARIPLLDKATVRLHAEQLVADNAPAFNPVWQRTSGSTGTPLRFMLGAESRIADAAATLRAYGWAGFRPGQKIFSIKEFSGGWEWRRSMAGRALNADASKLTKDGARRITSAVNAHRPGFFHGYPFAMAMLAKLAADQGLSVHAPHTIITFGESLPRTMRHRLEEAYRGARIFDFYGMTENSVLITDCPCGHMHVHEDYAYHEFLGADGGAIQAGRGEIVGTSYFNLAMPLIRYRTRDFGRLQGATAPAPCGRAFRTVSSIEGRREDFIRTLDGAVSNLFEVPMNAARGVAASQYVQDAPDHIYVNIVPSVDFDASSLAQVELEIRQRVGPGMRLEFRIVTELERRHGDSGKIPFLISRIGNTVYSPADYEEA